MWMLYGGLAKKSGMLDFTPKGIRSIVQTPTIEVVYLKDSRAPDGKKVFDRVQTLQRDQFSAYMTDVIYYKKHKNGYYIKRAEESIPVLAEEVFNGLSGCKKAFPWQYENECRLIVTVPKKFLNGKCSLIRINLDTMDLGESLSRIYHGPNYPDEETFDTRDSSLHDTVDWTID